MPEKHLKNDRALTLLELDEPRGKQTVDEQIFAAGLGMGPHDWMLGAREFAALRPAGCRPS